MRKKKIDKFKTGEKIYFDTDVFSLTGKLVPIKTPKYPKPLAIYYVTEITKDTITISKNKPKSSK